MALNNLRGLSDLAKAAKGKKGKEVLTVPVDDVVSKVQVRKRFRNIEELAATMLTEGQQSPIIVFPKNEEGKFVIQKGSDVGEHVNMQVLILSIWLSMIRSRIIWTKLLVS